MAADGVTKLPCPSEFGAILGTATTTGLFAVGLSFVPPKLIRKVSSPDWAGKAAANTSTAFPSSNHRHYACIHRRCPGVIWREQLGWRIWNLPNQSYCSLWPYVTPSVLGFRCLPWIGILLLFRNHSLVSSTLS